MLKGTESPETANVSREIRARVYSWWRRRIRKQLLPPSKYLTAVGSPDPWYFTSHGRAFLSLLQETGAMHPEAAILDAGCGCGLVAVPLTKYLEPTGTYVGFDVMPEMIEWCRANISTRYPNFQFHHVDVFNSFYNPEGRHTGAKFTLPYENQAFDLIFAKSLLSHLLPDDMENYCREFSRVLKPSGRCVLTAFLLSSASRRSIESGTSTLPFSHEHSDGRCKIIDPLNPETAVAYDERIFLDTLQKHGLKLSEPVRHGTWPHKHERLWHYQDVIVCVRSTQVKIGSYLSTQRCS